METLDIKFATICAQVPWRQARELRMLAKSEGISLSELMRRALRNEILKLKEK